MEQETQWRWIARGLQGIADIISDYAAACEEIDTKFVVSLLNSTSKITLAINLLKEKQV